MSNLICPKTVVNDAQAMRSSVSGTADEWLSLALDSAKMCAYKWDLKTNVIIRSKHSSHSELIDPANDTWLYEEGLLNVFSEDREFVHKTIQQAVAERKDFHFEFRTEMQKVIRWFECRGHAVYSEAGEGLHILCVTQEITRRKEDELSLKNQKRQIELTKAQLDLTLAAAGMIALPDRRPNKTFKCGKVCTFFGIENHDQELNRDLLLNLIHPDDRERVRQEFASVGAHDNKIYIEGRVILPNGDTRWILIKGSHVIGEDGGSDYIILQDITNRKNVEELITKRSHELSLINEKLHRFSSMVAHDLKNPLTAISLALELIAKEKNLEGVVKRAKNAGGVASRMATLIDEILIFARSDENDKLLKVPVAFEPMLDLVKGNLAAAILASRSEIIIHRGVSEIYGSSSQILQLFQNLISNAIKFRSDDVPFIEISAKDRGREFLISVKDNGIGIGADQSQKIFEPFERLNSEREGTGLGLAISKKIVEQHGGKIWVESRPGVGTEFLFTLPKPLSQENIGK